MVKKAIHMNADWSTAHKRVPVSGLDRASRLFFEKILIVKKEQELVFISKASDRAR